MATRTVKSIRRAILAIGIASGSLIGGPNAEAQYPETVERVERFFGIGWGDGYHACRSSGMRPGADLPPRSYAAETNSPLQRLRGCEAGTLLSQGSTVYHAFDAHCDSLGCDAAPSHAVMHDHMIEYREPAPAALSGPLHQRGSSNVESAVVMPPERSTLELREKPMQDSQAAESKVMDSSSELRRLEKQLDRIQPIAPEKDEAEELPPPMPLPDVKATETPLSSPSDLLGPPPATDGTDSPAEATGNVDALLDEADLLLDVTLRQPAVRLPRTESDEIRNLFQSWGRQPTPAPERTQRVATRLPSTASTQPARSNDGLIIRQPR